MAEVRFWRAEDLPDLRLFAVVNAWNILPPDDRAIAPIANVAASAEANLLRVLSSPGGTAIVAEDAGRPVGYMLVAVNTDDRTGEASGYLADIYIEPQYRRAGIATRFHEIGERYLHEMGLRKASIWTHAHNPLGQASAGRQGYQLRGMMLSRTLTPN